MPRAGGISAFAIGLVALAVGILLRLPLDVAAGSPLPPFITLFPAVIVAGVVGGVRVALFTLTLGLPISWYFWIPPYNSWAIADLHAALTLATFSVSGIVVAGVAGWVRRLCDIALDNENERAVVARETVHRIKNLIAVIQAISRHADASEVTVAAYRERIDGTLSALAAAQDVLLRRDWQDVDLGQTVEATLKPFRSPKLVIMDGPPITLPRGVVSSLCLALYELATNALKYGALRTESGCVAISWRTDGARCVLEWRESGAAGGGSADHAAGLGSTLIKSALSKCDGSSVRHSVDEAGVDCVFEWPDITLAPTHASPRRPVRGVSETPAE